MDRPAPPVPSPGRSVAAATPGPQRDHGHLRLGRERSTASATTALALSASSGRPTRSSTIAARAAASGSAPPAARIDAAMLRRHARTAVPSGSSAEAARATIACQPAATSPGEPRAGAPPSIGRQTRSGTRRASGRTVTAAASPARLDAWQSPGGGPDRTSFQTWPSETAAAPPGTRPSSTAVWSPTSNWEPRTPARLTDPLTARARLTGTGVSLTNSTTTPRPAPPVTAATCCTTSPPGTFMAVATTGMSSTRWVRTAVSSAATCQRSSAPTAQPTRHDDPKGSTVPPAPTVATGPSRSPTNSPAGRSGAPSRCPAFLRTEPGLRDFTGRFRWWGVGRAAPGRPPRRDGRPRSPPAPPR